MELSKAIGNVNGVLKTPVDFEILAIRTLKSHCDNALGMPDVTTSHGL